MSMNEVMRSLIYLCALATEVVQSGELGENEVCLKQCYLCYFLVKKTGNPSSCGHSSSARGDWQSGDLYHVSSGRRLFPFDKGKSPKGDGLDINLKNTVEFCYFLVKKE
jgi:hypothetical protein